MDIRTYRGYGLAASDTEGGWDPSFKARLKKRAFEVVMRHLGVFQKIRLLFFLSAAKRKAKGLDLTDLRARGMTNEAFLHQQLEYLSLFSALKRLVGKEKALAIAHAIMEATAKEAMLRSIPTPEEVEEYGDPLEFFQKYFAPMPLAAQKAGCHDLRLTECSEKVIQFDIHWCVWLELATRMGVPEACLPNCYADDVAYPEYFKEMGISYHRTGTLAQGCGKCDFRFEKMGG